MTVPNPEKVAAYKKRLSQHSHDYMRRRLNEFGSTLTAEAAAALRELLQEHERTEKIDWTKEPDPFESLVPLLVDAIPRSIAALKTTKPLCSLRIYYYDTHAPCTYLLLKPVSAECRAMVLATKGESALYCFWGSGEGTGDGPDVNLSGPAPIQRLFARVYGLLCEDESTYMGRFRGMLQRVARELNVNDWRPICPVTDDFVVVPADGSMHFGDDYEDIVQSVPAERVQLLRARGLLGPEDDWTGRTC
jgi:hypothetical protein